MRRRSARTFLAALLFLVALTGAVGVAYPVYVLVAVLPVNRHMAEGLLAVITIGWLASGLVLARRAERRRRYG